MYAHLYIALKTGIDSEALSRALRHGLGKSHVADISTIAGARAAEYVQYLLAAARYPDRSTVFFLQPHSDEIMAIIFADSIPLLKRKCDKIVAQFSKFPALAVRTTSATILVESGGSDIVVANGERISRSKIFAGAFREKVASKVMPSAVTAGLAIYYFVPNSQPVSSGIIALIAASIGTVAECVIATVSSTRWKWKEAP